jgi:hypothetical protein
MYESTTDADRWVARPILVFQLTKNQATSVETPLWLFPVCWISGEE